jgi:hypothetical protein
LIAAEPAVDKAKELEEVKVKLLKLKLIEEVRPVYLTCFDSLYPTVQLPSTPHVIHMQPTHTPIHIQSLEALMSAASELLVMRTTSTLPHHLQ